MSKILFSLAMAYFVFSGCSPMESNPKAKNKDFGIDVIYGEDDRIDFFEIQDQNWKDLAQSTAALFDHQSLLPGPNQDTYSLDTIHYGKSNNLCQSENFYDQPSGSFCSGFLIGPEIMVTAGHCIRNKFNCENVRFVFGYSYNVEDHDPLLIPKKSVYECKEIIHTQANGLTGSDFAIIRLTKKVTQFPPLKLRTQGRVNENTKLTVIGYPSGLPGKLASDGKVRNTTDKTFFVSTLDTYGGNSGSAVFNSDTRLIEGILVRGNSDFGYDTVKKCRVSNLCKETECRGEDVVRISEILKYLIPDDLRPIAQ